MRNYLPVTLRSQRVIHNGKLLGYRELVGELACTLGSYTTSVRHTVRIWVLIFFLFPTIVTIEWHLSI